MSVVPTTALASAGKSLRAAGGHAIEAGRAGFASARQGLHGFSGDLSSAIKEKRVLGFAKGIAVENPLKVGAGALAVTAGTVALVSNGTAAHTRAMSDQSQGQGRGR